MAAAPLPSSYAAIDAFLDVLPNEVRAGYEAEIRELVARSLPPAVSPDVVAALFGCSPRFVRSVLRAPHRYYRCFRIRRKHKIRTIEAPHPRLKAIQRWLGTSLQNAVALPDCVYGFRPGRSAVQAAAAHCGARWVFELDLEDFFPSIAAGRMRRSLEGIGYTPEASAVLAGLCCVRGHLAQGSPASPAMSNLVFRAHDHDLGEIARAHDVRYTRYADDIVFSGRGDFPQGLDDRVIAYLEANGWSVNARKVHLAVRPRPLRCHGLLVHGEVPRLPKRYRNRIRAYRHLWAAGRIDRTDRDRVRGHLAYAKSVEAVAATPAASGRA